ncbi:MAG TPA: radical SAM protein [Desulfobulbaceae bacterium]|nr:radical SAM protein [Desulfobulbaceae bacterium]
MKTSITSFVPAFAAESLTTCRLCPRDCGVNRHESASGFCRADDSLAIASITIHHGEEPVLGGDNGVCNVFFRHCNLACRYCQNYQISRNDSALGPAMSLGEVTVKITAILARGVGALGFVSPSHMLPQMLAIIESVRSQGYNPVIIYNSNGYDRVPSLRQLEDAVDIYLPDCKYMDGELAWRWSLAADYPQVARAALKEMYRQKGNVLHIGANGLARRGLIVRHLVLPGALENTERVLEFLATDLSPKLHLSLMSQYHPTSAVAAEPLLRRGILSEEYQQARAAMRRLGFTNGWAQDCASADFYRPDFNRDQPFSD